MKRRPHIPLSKKLAAALLQLGHVPYQDAKQMTAAQINSLYNFDHYPIRHADDGPTEPWNLRPLLIQSHRIKTAKVDAPAMAKDRDIAAAELEHKRRMSLKWLHPFAKMEDLMNERPKRKIPSRGFSQQHRPMRERKVGG